MTTKPQGLAKIWREVKRPFRQGRKNVDRGVRKLYYPLLHWAYRKAAKKSEIILSESRATETIVRDALKIPEIFKACVTEAVVRDALKSPEIAKSGITESIVQDALNSPAFVKKLFVKPTPYQDDWGRVLTVAPEELRERQNKLLMNTDELSREVVARYIVRRQFCMEYKINPWKQDNPMWHAISGLLRSVYPLAHADQEHIKTLNKAYTFPYKFPEIELWVENCLLEHCATHFSLNQFPLEIQKKIVGKDIIDGGGYVGESAMIFTEYDPKKVYTFEPNPGALPVISQVLEDNATSLGDRKSRIEVIPMALGKSKGTLSFHSSDNLDAGAGLSKTWKPNAHEVDVISIDEFAKDRTLDIGLIKLDVEGAEYDTILGAKEMIAKQKPLLLISLYHTFKDFFEIKPLIESWELGYKFEIRHHEPSTPDWGVVLMAYCEK